MEPNRCLRYAAKPLFDCLRHQICAPVLGNLGSFTSEESPITAYVFSCSFQSTMIKEITEKSILLTICSHSIVYEISVYQVETAYIFSLPILNHENFCYDLSKSNKNICIKHLFHLHFMRWTHTLLEVCRE